jgi:hypothetical protein
MKFSRRDLFKRSVAASVAGLVGHVAFAADDPLPSWNDTGAKKAIVDFVHVTTDRASEVCARTRTNRDVRPRRNVVG